MKIYHYADLLVLIYFNRVVRGMIIMGTVKLIDILKIINRNNSIIIKDNGNVVFEGMVKDSVEVLNNMYNKSNGVWTDKLYIKSFKELNIDNITEIEITEKKLIASKK